MAEKPTPSGPSAAQLALIKKYLSAAGWGEQDLEQLFAPETGTPRPQMTEAESSALENKYIPNLISAMSSDNPGLISKLASAATEGAGLYDPQISMLIDEHIKSREGLTPGINDAEGYRKIFEGFVGDFQKYQNAYTELEQKYIPIEEKKGLPNRDDRYSAPVGWGALDPSVVDRFFPNMTKNLADYSAKNPETMYDLPMVDRPNAPMSTTGIKPAALIQTLQSALQGEPDPGGSYMVNGTRVNGFDIRTLLDSLTNSQKTLPKGSDIVQSKHAPGIDAGVTETNWKWAQKNFGPSGTTPNMQAYKKAQDIYNKDIAALNADNAAEQAVVDKKKADLDTSNFAAMKAILDKNPAPWVKGAVGGPVASTPQKMLTQKGGQGQANINPTFQWQNMLAVAEAKKRLDASGRTPYWDALLNMARSGAANLSK